MGLVKTYLGDKPEESIGRGSTGDVQFLSHTPALLDPLIRRRLEWCHLISLHKFHVCLTSLTHLSFMFVSDPVRSCSLGASVKWGWPLRKTTPKMICPNGKNVPWSLGVRNLDQYPGPTDGVTLAELSSSLPNPRSAPQVNHSQNPGR